MITNTEQRILEAAETEFFLKGFAGARTTSIAKNAGVSNTMLHYYYGTKERLFSRVIADKITELAESFSVNISREDTLEQSIRRAIVGHFEFVRANPALPRFMAAEVLGNPQLIGLLAERISQVASNTLTSLQQLIDRGADRGECRQVSAVTVLIDILSLNVFAVMMKPMIDHVSQRIPLLDADRFLDERREENVATILSKLKP